MNKYVVEKPVGYEDLQNSLAEKGDLDWELVTVIAIGEDLYTPIWKTPPDESGLVSFF